jgi:hypothetical protein
LQIFEHGRALPGADASDEDRSHGDGVHEHLPGCAGEQDRGRALVVGIGGIQMPDQDALARV